MKREWVSLLASTGLGVLAALCVDLLARDESFRSYLISHYEPAVSFDDPKHYFPYLVVVGIAIVLASAAFLFSFVTRGIKSWLAGVTSGLVLLPFVSSFVLSLIPSSRLHHRLIIGLAATVFWFLIGLAIHLVARVGAERTVSENELRVPPNVRSLAGSELAESDDPIQSWEQDAMGRAALVDSLTVKIMIAKAPVIALSGAFGVGKTSILNLLREHLGKIAITVSFSTWLPGSQETLTSYLFADVANQCNKHYLVPGLRRSTRQLAIALGQRVPLLSDYLKLLPAATQKDEIDNVKSALLRLPKRVVVLLDEMDRMDKDELVTLLKVIRGVSTLPNLSFVCAGHLETIAKTLNQSDEYFEKFFPVLIPIPQPDSSALRTAGTKRLTAVFVGRDWFDSESECGDFEKRVERIWSSLIEPFCKNLRTVGLLANDVSVAAALLHREVDPLDLALVEMLRRFRPDVYRLVEKNAFALTGGESLARGGGLHDDEEEDKARKRVLEELKAVLPDDEEREQARRVLDELFPLVSKADRQLRRSRRPENQKPEKEDKRIREPGMFPAYFRYQLPEGIFSSVELDAAIGRIKRTEKQRTRDTIFADILRTMGKGTLKRDDFLRKVAGSVKTIDISTAKSLVESAVRAAADYVYDTFHSFGEAGHVLRMILFLAQRLSQSERVDFLRACILNATDDTMAFRILTILTRQTDDSNLHVSIGDLYGSFVKRMRGRYGPDADVATADLKTSDPWAFDLWGRQNVDGVTADPKDREMQYGFWRRYIGNRRSVLAEAFRGFFLPLAAYEQDPTPLVENKFPVAELRRLYETLPHDPHLTESDQKALATLKRFLDGDFKNGISPLGNMY